MPWISFCISTFKRPQFLEEQLTRISRQTFRDYEVIISDNDPECSAREVVRKFDERFHYYANNQNVGMINSFNKSIERSVGEYILMITDDDFINDDDKIRKFNEIYKQHPGYPVYINCSRKKKKEGEIEISSKDDFAYQLLNPYITREFLWSDSILQSAVVKSLSGIPDYGSPHLADHALLALCGKESGGVFINQAAARMNLHTDNFSRSNLALYYKGCCGFYSLMTKNFTTSQLVRKKNVVIIHLSYWAVSCLISLRRYYLKNHQYDKLEELKGLSRQIFQLPYMKQASMKFKIRSVILNLKILKAGIMGSLKKHE